MSVCNIIEQLYHSTVPSRAFLPTFISSQGKPGIALNGSKGERGVPGIDGGMGAPGVAGPAGIQGENGEQGEKVRKRKFINSYIFYCCNYI